MKMLGVESQVSFWKFRSDALEACDRVDDRVGELWVAVGVGDDTPDMGRERRQRTESRQIPASNKQTGRCSMEVTGKGQPTRRRGREGATTFEKSLFLFMAKLKLGELNDSL